MSSIKHEQVSRKISNIVFNDGKKLQDVVSNIIIKGKDVGFAIDIAGYAPKEAESIRIEAIKKISEIADIGKITIILTSSVDSDKTQSENKTRAKHFIENAKKVILVAAGKGGVGKSTMAALIAEHLKFDGYNVGIVDADIYGPSIPRIFGIHQKPDIIDRRIIPLKARGIEIISIGFLLEEDATIAWRGPMASKAIYQLLSLTKWGNLDYLIIDMPPGTSDIHLSILENYKLDGAIIVTTPQKIAEIDVRKTIELYKKFNLPILGMIENMSYFVIPNSEQYIQIFNGDSGSSLAKEYNTPLICQLPISPKLAKACDQGLSLTNIVDFPVSRFI
jgi:ATP-binding protein involved in chromosome partitioning